VRAWHHTYGLPVLTTNCSNNYGPITSRKAHPADDRQRPGRQAAAGVRRRHAGARLAVRGDHCSAIRRVLQAGRLGETYNVGGWNEKPNIEIVHTVCALLDELRPRADGRATAADHLRHRPPRPRPPLRHRRARSSASWLAPGRDLRHRHPQDRAVVSGPPDWVAQVQSGAYRDWVAAVRRPRMTILLLGKNGQVGWELQRSLAPLGR
jgi:dTDP-glucose 4,6-dehydratase